MDENDGIAGRYEHDFVGFSSQVGGIYTYYFILIRPPVSL